MTRYSNYYQNPSNDKRSLIIMAGLLATVVALIVIIVIVIINNNAPLNPPAAKNLMISEKSLRQSAANAFESQHIATTPRQIFLEKIDFDNEWIFLKTIAANISPTNPSRILYTVFKKNDKDDLQLVAYSNGREAWRTIEGNTLPDNIRERAGKLWEN